MFQKVTLKGFEFQNFPGQLPSLKLGENNKGWICA